MPNNIDISYSEKEKYYVILNCDNNEEGDDVNELSKSQLKVINNKISAVQNHSDRVKKTALLKFELIIIYQQQKIIHTIMRNQYLKRKGKSRRNYRW